MFLYTKNKLKNFLKNMFVSQKSKRVFIIALLFFVFCGVVVPQLIFAAGGSWYLNLLPFGVGGVMDLALSAKSSMSEGFYNAIIYGASSLGVAISGSLFGIAVGFFKWVISDSFVSFSYTGFDNPVVASGWPIVRDFANIIVILGFVVIGIATIVRYKSYEAGKILVPLIIAAILINFSLIFCGIIIDGSNLGMKFFLSGGASGDGIFSGFTKVVNDQKAILMSPDDSNPIQFAGKMTAMMLNYTIQAMIFALYGCLFMFRYIALWILVTLSPLAFVCYVFPATKKVFSMWWSNFIAWCIIGISGAFFVYLSDRMVSVLITTKKMVGFGDIGFADLTVYLVPAGLLVFGFLISLQTSAMGANFITSRARGWYNKGTGMLSKGVTGGAKLGASKLANISGASGLYNRGVDKLVAGAEKAGFLKMGASAKRKAKQMEGVEADMEYEESKTIADAYKTQETRTEDGRKKKAKMVEILSKRGDLNMVGDLNEQKKAIEHAEKHYGGDKARRIREEAEKLNPELAAENKQKVDRIYESYGTKKGTPGYTINDAKKQAVREAYARSGAGEAKDLNDKDVTTKTKEVDADGKISKDGAKALEEAVKRGITDGIGPLAEVARLIKEAEDRFGSNVRNSAEKKDTRLRAFNEYAVQKIIADDGLTGPNAENIAKARAVKYATEGLGDSDLLGLSEKALESVEVQSGLSLPAVKLIGEKGKQKSRNALRRTLNNSSHRIRLGQHLVNSTTGCNYAPTSTDVDQVANAMSHVLTDANYL